jgi:hypothetical protein
MPKSYAQLQQSLTFDELMKTLDEQFRTFPDCDVVASFVACIKGYARR